MPADVANSIKSLLEQKRMVANSEKRLIDDLNRRLPDIGYRIVAREGAIPSDDRIAVKKVYTCRMCSRRFGHWLHLGRHMSTMHRNKKAVAKKLKATSTAGSAKKKVFAKHAA